MTDMCISLGDDLNFDTLYKTLDVYYKTMQEPIVKMLDFEMKATEE